MCRLQRVSLTLPCKIGAEVDFDFESTAMKVETLHYHHVIADFTGKQRSRPALFHIL